MTKFGSLFAMLLLLLGGLGGCKQVQETVDRLTDEELAEYVYNGSKFTAKTGLRAVLDRHPEHVDLIKADATKASKIISENIIPIFNGATSSEVLRSAIDAALDELAANLYAPTIDIIKLALHVVAGQIELPENPASKLDDRTRKAVVAFFTGLVDAVSETFPVVTPVPAPEPVPADPVSKTSALKWAKPAPLVTSTIPWSTGKSTLLWPLCKCQPCKCDPCGCD
jgi:hypothetical protein